VRPSVSGRILFWRVLVENRRSFAHRLLGAALLVGDRWPAARRVVSTALRSANRAPFGALVSESEISDPRTERLFAAACQGVTIAGPLYWGYSEAVRGAVDLSAARRLLAWASARRLSAHAHTLVWHQLEPMWLSDISTPSEARSVLSGRVERLLEELGDLIPTWDLLNEPLLLSDNQPGGLRKSRWLQLLGPEYVIALFRTARMASARCRFGINETHIEDDSPHHAARRERLLSLIRLMHSRGTPPDFVGIQGHLLTSQTYSHAGLGAFAEQVQSLGVSIRVSELDCRSTSAYGDLDAYDEAIAGTVDRFLSVLCAATNLEMVTCWGLRDDKSWLHSVYQAPADLPHRPLPFSADDRAKPMYHALRAWTTIGEGPRRASQPPDSTREAFHGV
jgi:endo-1,4-beta-xylanase